MPKGIKGFEKGHPVFSKKGQFKKGVKTGIVPRSAFKKGCIPWNKGRKYLPEEHSRWKGGRRKTSCYIYIYKPKHPFATKKGYVFEHRLVMEKYLGRYLKSTEYIHHINANGSDNRIENLKLFVLNKNWHLQICPKCNFEFLIK